MDLIINRGFNDLHGLLSSLMLISNHNYFKIQIEEKWNLSLDKEMEVNTRKIRENPVFDKVEYYIDMEIGTRDIFINPDLMSKSENLNEYINHLRQEKEDDLREAIFTHLGFEELIDFKNKPYLELALEKINQMNYQSQEKWYLISLIQNPKSHIDKFIDCLKEYLPLYEGLKKIYWKDYEDFVKWIDVKVSEEGIDFIDKYLSFVNLKQYSRVYLNYSIFDLITSTAFKDGSIHIFVGLIFKRYVEEEENKNDIDRHLNIYKVLSDRTRFDIIKILIENESYGQEIAEQLGITTATVSYHMDFLFGASLVTMKRKSRRVYYSLNKEEIRGSIRFLENELRL